MNHITDDIDASVITRNTTSRESLKQEAFSMEQDSQVVGIDNKHWRPKLGLYQPLLFSAKELSSSIIASENTRVTFSISIALLVVLSYIDYPIFGVNIVNSKSIIALRPLYMVFMTEIVVLIAYLVLERQRRLEHETGVSKGGGVNWDRAERLLEGGVVVHQTIRAVFIDFSVYVVTVICFLSLVTTI
ncbi:Phosphopentomutase [Bienertia sinuspersici]